MRLKTTTEIKAHSQMLRDDASQLSKASFGKQIKEIKERIVFNDECIAYLNTEPSVECVANTKTRLKERIATIVAENRHTAKGDLPKLRNQLRMVSYILD